MLVRLNRYMVESVNLPCIRGALCAFILGMSNLVRILWCAAHFGYLKGTLQVPLKYAKLAVHPRNLTILDTQGLSALKVPKVQGRFTDSTIWDI